MKISDHIALIWGILVILTLTIANHRLDFTSYSSLVEQRLYTLETKR